MNTTFRLALRLLRRDWRAHELHVLAAALLVAVSCVTAVSFFTDRIEQALERQASELLAADLRVLSDGDIAQELMAEAVALQLQQAQTRSFRSMLLVEGRSHLAEIKAVSDSYPLRGSLRIARNTRAPDEVTDSVPRPGTVWVEADLLRALALSIGDRIQLGQRQFVIDALLRYEPDRSGEVFSIAPRILMHLDDLAATELIQEGSRIRSALLLAGEPQQIQQYRKRIESMLAPGQRIEGVNDARQEVRIALSRAQQFLGLSALVSLILACVAIAMSARRYAQRHLDTCAIMRCLGASQARISGIYIYQLLIIGVVLSLLGCLVGFAAQVVLAKLLGALLLVELPSASLTPFMWGLCVGMLSLMGFALPPLFRLRKVPTLRVLRRDLGQVPNTTVGSYLFGLLGIALLMLWVAGDVMLGAAVLAGVVLAALVLVVLARGLIGLIRRLPGGNRSAWRFGVGNITRHAQSSVVQIIAFGIGMTVLLLLGVVRGDILDAWRHQLPADAANRFVINIQPQQVAGVQALLQQEGLEEVRLYPMIRARLRGINGEDPEVSSKDPRAQHLAHREFNLSWAETMQGDNRIIAGQWWKPDTRVAQFSVEEGLAQRLGMVLGDRIRFEIAGEVMEGEITSLRSVQWDTFRPNFFVLSPPAALQDYPASYITSFYLPHARADAVDRLVSAFPNLTVIDISAVMNQVRTIVDRVSAAVEYVFLFTLIAGMTVLYAAIQATHDERVQTNAVLRALGVGRARLLQGLMAEFFVLGALAGLIASLGAYGLGNWLAVEVFELPYYFNAWLIVVGVVGGGFGIGLVGTLGTRRVLARPPLQALRMV